jgi:hypothetical protein
MTTATGSSWAALAEVRRVIVLEILPVGPDAVVLYGDLDHPGTEHRSALFQGEAPGGLHVGELGTITRVRPARASDRRDAWHWRWTPDGTGGGTDGTD